LGALAEGTTHLTNLSTGQDVASTLNVVQALGCAVEQEGQSVTVTGRGARGFAEPVAPLNCGNSGTTTRLMTGVLASQSIFSVLVGDRSLSRRPMSRVVDPLKEMGARIWGRENHSRLPLAILGGELHGTHHVLPVASAQVKTALLLAGLRATGETTVTEPAQSRDHTERLFSWLGLPFEKNGLTYRIQPAGVQGFSLAIPGDFSSAAYFLALGAIHPKAELVVEQVNLNPTRTGFLQILREMGAVLKIEETASEPEPVGNVQVQSSPLKNVDIPAEKIPNLIDELPLLAVVATQAEGTLTVRGASELRVKESDRIATIVKGLRKMGAQIEEFPDGFAVTGPTKLTGARVQSFGDHRIAMSLTVAALVAEGTTQLHGDRWVRISYPGFFDDLEGLVGGGR
jgi:3-phosphoshikimate 1-carboxyvinyltransferase